MKRIIASLAVSGALLGAGIAPVAAAAAPAAVMASAPAAPQSWYHG
jgi:hypothetical protein